ncbi:MAG TPA: hypothetical protein VIH59_10585, partial [Candidatus Tectomicrobia bacterium]
MSRIVYGLWSTRMYHYARHQAGRGWRLIGPLLSLLAILPLCAAQATTILSQDGSGFSGSLDATPLGSSITMTGYNSWPAGFTKNSSAFIGGVSDGQRIWLIPYGADRVITVDKDSGTMTGYNSWPAGFTKGGAAFFGGVFDGQRIWLIPWAADRVIAVDKD